MKRKRNLLKKLILYSILIGMASFGIFIIYKYDKPVIIKDLPDPFLFNNGTRVDTIDDWVVRRAEIKDLLLNMEYGHMPERPDAINASEQQSTIGDGGSIQQIVKLTIIPSNSTPNSNFNLTIWIYSPSGAGPFPTVIKVGEDGSGSEAIMNHKMVERGYIYVCFNHKELDPDTQGYDVVGPCQQSYPSYDWGSIAVWAWGAMRVADYLLGESWVSAPEGLPNVDPDKLIITGHSRRGKTSLLAGALDERFAMVAPNGAGCGGTGSFLVQGIFCETIAFITADWLYKAWFQKDFNNFAWKEADLPFDQHFLRALVAPRIIISTDGIGDLWSNPAGTQAIYDATIPVFEFLGVKENNAIHYRGGFHAYSESDFKIMLDFADKMLLHKDVSGNFYMTPFKFQQPVHYEIP